MERALAVIDPSEESHDLLREAGELAAGVDAALVVLAPLTEEAYERDLEVLETIADEEHTSFGADSMPEYAEQTAAAVADEVLDGLEVDYEPKGVVVDGDRGTAIVRAAEEAGCDHVFLVGKRRSPTGKAVFGDATQSVILNFDGRTTVAMADGD